MGIKDIKLDIFYYSIKGNEKNGSINCNSN